MCPCASVFCALFCAHSLAGVKPVHFFGATDKGDKEIDVLELDRVRLRLLGNEISGHHDGAEKIFDMLHRCAANIADHASIQYGDIIDARVCFDTAPRLPTAWVMIENLEQILPHTGRGVFLLDKHLVLFHPIDIARIHDKEPQTKRFASRFHFALFGLPASGIITTASGPIVESHAVWSCLRWLHMQNTNKSEQLGPAMIV